MHFLDKEMNNTLQAAVVLRAILPISYAMHAIRRMEYIYQVDTAVEVLNTPALK